MPDNLEFEELAARLISSLGLRQEPIAIRFTESVPSECGGPEVPVPAGCRFWQDAANKTFVTSADDHGLCAVGIYTHNLRASPVQQTDLVDALKVFGELGYVRPEDVRSIPVLRMKPKYVVYGPLAEAQPVPDVVLLFVNARQILLLSEAAQQIEIANPPAMGRPACAIIPQVVNSGRAALSLGCCGARAYLDVLTDDTAVFAIPGSKLPTYVERIEVLNTANTVLSRFHQIRRGEIEAGRAPTVKESLAALK